MAKALRDCLTAEEVAEHYRAKLPDLFAPRAERPATRRADGSRELDAGKVKAIRDWRRWRDELEDRQRAELAAYERADCLAARAGRKAPAWGGEDRSKRVRVAFGNDVVFESGPGGFMRRASSPSFPPGGPRVAARADVTVPTRTARSNAAKARNAARKRAAAAQARAQRLQDAADRRMLGTGGVHLI